MRIMTIDPVGVIALVDSADDTTAGKLAALNAAVGGYLELCAVNDPGLVAYANEDGVALGLPANVPGTALLRMLGWRGWAAGGAILGTVCLAGRRGPDEISLTDAQVARLFATMGVTK